jgi:hypothetical protein
MEVLYCLTGYLIERKMKYLKAYYRLQRKRKKHYLCFMFGCDPLFELFIPTLEEKIQHKEDGYSPESWGDTKSQAWELSTFTPLRQNVVLLMAAMNNEL